jgi:hypothetical protein
VKQRVDNPEFKTLATLAERGVFMPVPAATAVTLANGTRRELTARERNDYQQQTGAGYREFIRKNGTKLVGMDPDKAADFISRGTSPIRRDVLRKVASGRDVAID